MRAPILVSLIAYYVNAENAKPRTRVHQPSSVSTNSLQPSCSPEYGTFREALNKIQPDILALVSPLLALLSHLAESLHTTSTKGTVAGVLRAHKGALGSNSVARRQVDHARRVVTSRWGQ
jgi:hypothetical protein